MSNFKIQGGFAPFVALPTSVTAYLYP